MDSTLSTISYMFTPTVLAGPTPPKPPATKNSPKPIENPPPISTPQTTTTDNTYAVAQKAAENAPPQQFQNTLDKKVANKVTQQTQAQASTETNTQCPVAAQPAVVQNWLTEYIKKPKQDDEKGNTEALHKVGHILAQSLAEVKPSKPAATAAQSKNPGEEKPSITTEKQQAGLNTTATKISNTSATIENLPASDKATTTANSNELQNSNETTAQTPTSSKSIITDKLTASDKSETTVASNKESMTKAADTIKTTTSENPKTLQSNTDLPTTESKTLASQQNAQTEQEGSSATEKPAENQTAQILPESANDNGKTPQPDQNNLSANPILQKLKPQDIQVSTEQKDRDSSTQNNNSNSNFEQILSQNNPQAPVTDQTSATSQVVAKNPDAVSPDNIAKNVNEQILESIHSSLRQGDQQITIRLNPPELGTVTIKFQQTDDQIIGSLEVSKTQTRAEIQQALPQLIQDLRDSGVPIKRLDVTLTDQPEQQTSKEHLYQDGTPSQQTSTEADNQNYKNTFEWLTNTNGYLNSAETQDLFITDNSINMLI